VALVLFEKSKLFLGFFRSKKTDLKSKKSLIKFYQIYDLYVFFDFYLY